MGRAAPLCHSCQQRVSARGDQGLTCGSCQRADHFKCLKLSEEKKSAILSGDQSYLCVSCKGKQRLSLSFVATTTPTNNKSGPTKAKVTHSESSVQPKDNLIQGDGPSEIKQASSDASLISALLTTIQALNETIKRLELKLEQASNQPRHQQTKTDTKEPRVISFTVHGVADNKYKDPREVVEKILKVAEKTLDPTATVKKLPTKDSKRQPVILVSLKPDSDSVTVLKQLKRRKLSGSDINITNCDSIFVNESYPSRVYQLLREAKKLKQHGYRFVWVQNNRVLARTEENSPVIQIKDVEHVNTIISSTADQQNDDQQ